MANRQKVNLTIVSLLQEGIRTIHNRIVLAGLFIGLCYFPVWLSGLLKQSLLSSASLNLIIIATLLGVYSLWQKRHHLSKLKASEEDRLIGHIFILSGVFLFPFCRFDIWSQALIWLLILIGIACSSWGLTFFSQNLFTVLMLSITVYPNLSSFARALWEILFPNQIWNSSIAWISTLALQAIGQPAVAHGSIITLPQGSVEVGWGCNGLSMVLTMSTAGLLMGWFLKQPWQRIGKLITLGALLALVFNIPRIMLLTFASVYWGKGTFDFLHGTWGGQLFSAVLFTVYYYAAMWFINRRSVTNKS